MKRQKTVCESAHAAKMMLTGECFHVKCKRNTHKQTAFNTQTHAETYLICNYDALCR